MKKYEALKIVGLVVFFFIMGVIVGYNIKNQPIHVHDTETVSKSEREPL